VSGRAGAARAGWGWCAVLALAVSGCEGASSPEDGPTPQASVVVWTGTADFPLAPVVAAYTKESGVPVEIVSGGDSPPARTDLLLSSDSGPVWIRTVRVPCWNG